MTTYLKAVKRTSKQNFENYFFLKTGLKAVDTVIFTAKSSTSLTLSVTGFGLKLLPKSSGNCCGLSLTVKVLYEISINAKKSIQLNKLLTLR